MPILYFLNILLLFITLLVSSIHSQEEASPEKEEPVTSTEAADDSWESELDKELKDQEDKSKLSSGSKNTPPIQNPNTVNRSAQNLMMDISAAVDAVGVWDKQKPQTTENKLDIRSAEFGFSGAVDQWLRGNLLIAAHPENGKYMFEVHEAWLQLPFLPFNTSLKAGMMFLDIGRINKIHLHDRPFTKSPIVHEKFIGFESLFDTGAEFSFLLPWSFITQELVIGGTNGQKFGHSHNSGEKKNNPLGYAHLKNFYYLGDNWGTQFGFTALRYEPSQNSKNEKMLYGIDFVLKWNQSNLKEFTLMSEFWYNKEVYPMNSITYNPTNGSINPEPNYFPYPGRSPNKIQLGHYIFANYKFHQLWAVGYRYDYFKDFSIKTKEGYMANSAIESNTFQVTFYPSEFSYIRASYERRYTKDSSSDDFETRIARGLVVTPDLEKVEHSFYIQGVIILGSHPAHNY